MEEEFKSKWNSGEAYAKKLTLLGDLLDYYIQIGDKNNALITLDAYYDSLSPNMKEIEITEAEKFIAICNKNTIGVVCARDEYFSNRKQNDFRFIRKTRRYLLRIQFDRGLLNPIKVADKDIFDGETFAKQTE